VAVGTVDGAIDRHRQQGHDVRATGVAGHVGRDQEGLGDLFRRREQALGADDRDRVVLAGVLAGDVVQARRADRSRIVRLGDRFITPRRRRDDAMSGPATPPIQRPRAWHSTILVAWGPTLNAAP
jgi:hypothetical protein